MPLIQFNVYYANIIIKNGNYQNFNSVLDSAFDENSAVSKKLHQISPYMTRYPFFTSCLPWFVLHRVNEYCYGPILASFAIECYLLVLRAAEAKRYLSEINRKRAYVIVTSFIASCVIGDGIGRYLMGYQKWLCTFAYSKSAWDGILSAILFYFFLQ